jgi:fibronectin type 3 domain-containing protein
MRRYAALFLAAFIIVLSACPTTTDPGDPGKIQDNNGNGEETKPSQDGKTWVCFVNDNDFSVTIYRDSSRLSKFADVTANSKSSEIETAPNGNAVFYFIYHISIDDVPFVYEEQGMVVRIDAEKITTLTIPRLSELSPDELEKPVTARVYIKIQNAGSFALSLKQGNYEATPQGTNSPILNGGETGHYLINAGPVSDYSFMKNTSTPVIFPAGLTKFVSGHFYSLKFDGNVLTLLADKPITLAQALEILPPENISAKSLANGRISLVWDKTGTETNYVIYRSESETGTYTRIGTSELTSYTDDTVFAANTYYYRISSIKSSTESAKSTTVVSARAEIGPFPEGLDVIDQSPDGISLSWQEVSDVTGYKVYKGADMEHITEYVAETFSTSYTVTGLEPDTSYYFTVTAVSERGESLSSDAVQGTTSRDGTIPLPPAKPAGLVVSGAEPGSVTLSWNSAANADSYDIYRANSEYNTPVKTGTVTGTAWTDDTVSAGAMYYYSVRAVNPSGPSPNSNRVFAVAGEHFPLPTYSSSQLLSLPAYSKHYYRFAVSAGQSYTITWQNGSGSNTSSYVRCTAWQNNGTAIFTDAYGYSSPRTFTAASDGYVTVKVENTYNYSIYDYQIYYQE